MIQTLDIRNIALIEHIRLSFHNGMHVLSGETGAGKSIIVDAVNLVLGSRADRELIRSGCDTASVEAVFDVPDNERICAILTREQVEYDGRTVTVYREISAGGKNICRICGVILPLSVLKEIAVNLMDIHGQNEHRFLTDPDRHRQFLDQMGDKEHQQLILKVEESCSFFLKNHREYVKLIRENETKQSRIDDLERSLKELSEARLKPGEDEELEQKCKALRASEKTMGLVRETYRLLSASETDLSAIEKIKKVKDLLLSVSAVDPDVSDLSKRCESAFYEMEEIAYELYERTEKTENNAEKLEIAESRLDLIRRMKRKYGNSLTDVLESYRKMQGEYDALCGLDDRISEMSKQHKRLLTEYRNNAQSLSASRKRLAEIFEHNMKRELDELGLGNTVFTVFFADKTDGKPQMPKPTGDDSIEFMISSNPGEPMKPLARIASGGELSRFMLAIKTLEAGHSEIDSMVFDEIDTGISGRMAQIVSEKMIRISRERQIICVTHLPQIATAADHQYVVSKYIRDGRTYTNVEELGEDGRAGEIARLVSGAGGITDDAVAYAEKMIINCNNMKNEKLRLSN